MPSGPRGADDLHGNVPDNRATVLMLVDVINDLDFPRNEELVWKATSLARTIAMLKARCRKARAPAIYVNDNLDRWRSDFRGLSKTEAPLPAGYKLPSASRWVHRAVVADRLAVPCNCLNAWLRLVADT